MTQRTCSRFFVSGTVQGVFFRASTAREAARLNLTGWAKNLPDGRVEVLACGTAGCIDELAAWLAKGPPHAKVDEVVRLAADPDEATALNAFSTA